MLEINNLNPKTNSTQEDQEEINLRPKTLQDFIGQTNLKSNLKVFIEAAKKRKEPLEHTLFYGPPGLGKTTLSMIISNEMGGNLYQTSGPAVEKQGDLASILTNLQEGDILFIDEIHRLKTPIEEILYTALEDYFIDIVIGKGPSARSMRIDLPRFTLIGATTKASMVSAPLRDRLGQVFRLNYYSESEISKIVERSSKVLDIQVDKSGVFEIAKRSRFTPRIANRLLRRVRDFAEIKHEGFITEEIAKSSLEALEVDQIGLDQTCRDLLKIIIEKYNGGPVGVSTLAASLSDEVETIESVYEPFLLQLGFIQRTPRGRTATALAYKHLGFGDRLNEQKLL